MTTPLVLFATAVVAGSLAGYPLARSGWAERAPRLAVALWHAVSLGVVSSIVLGGMALALPVLPQVLTGGWSDFLARCAMPVRVGWVAPHSLLLGSLGLLLMAATLGRLIGSAVASTLEARRVRRTQQERVALAGRRIRGDHGEDLVVLADDRPVAYCLPGAGGRGTIVVSSGAIDLLADDQVRLVLAHERAHLRQRHHLATRPSAVLVGGFGWVPLFRLAAREVPLLLEMAADDQAMRTTGARHPASARLRGGARRSLAHALVKLTSAPPAAPAGSLAAAGGSAVARVHRLSQPPHPLGATRTVLLGIGIVVAFAGPLLVASAPALCAAAMEICPFAFA